MSCIILSAYRAIALKYFSVDKRSRFVEAELRFFRLQIRDINPFSDEKNLVPTTICGLFVGTAFLLSANENPIFMLNLMCEELRSSPMSHYGDAHCGRKAFATISVNAPVFTSTTHTSGCASRVAVPSVFLRGKRCKTRCVPVLFQRK